MAQRTSAAQEKTLYCPSAPAVPGVARVFGVVGGTADEPRVDYLTEPVLLTPELAEMSGELAPEEIFRVTSPCEERRCEHYTGSSCGLGARLVRERPAVSQELPPCSIRPSCRWFKEQGPALCLACPQVVTHTLVVSVEHASPQRRLRVIQPQESLVRAKE